MRLVYFDCFSGISGDMTIGAFLDAGFEIRALSDGLKRLKLKDYRLKSSKVKRGELSGTKFECVVEGNPHSHGYKSLKEILDLIGKSALNERVKDISKAIFINIGKAEAVCHGAGDYRKASFHELGHIDSIIDIVGTAIAVDELDIDEAYSSQVSMGRTVIKTAHGTWPIPSPASMELLKGADVKMSEIEAELVTPTGAGILKTLAKGFGQMPRMNMEAIGYGAGSMDLEKVPNMLRVVIGEAKPSYKEDRVFVIETNIDDMSPQNFEYLFERLFKEGALDVYTANIQMKKSRPAFKLTVLSGPEKVDKLSSIIFSETTSIGLRFYEAGRFKLERETVRAKTRHGNVNVKVSKGPDGILTVSPEYEDVTKLARLKKIPFKVVYEEARAAVKI